MTSLGMEYIVGANRELIENIKSMIIECDNENIENLFFDIINEIEDNYYTSKQIKKILTTLLHSMEMIKENLDKNKVIVDEYINNKYEQDNNIINELIDGIIISSINEQENKKLKYYGYLLGNILFQNSLDQDECNRLIKLSSVLSYSHIKLINMYVISQTIQVPILKREDYTKCGIKDYKLLGILQDTLDMLQRGILNGSGKIVLDVVQINPSKVKVQGIGTLLYNLMSINKMPYDELEDLLDILAK